MCSCYWTGAEPCLKNLNETIISKWVVERQEVASSQHENSEVENNDNQTSDAKIDNQQTVYDSEIEVCQQSDLEIIQHESDIPKLKLADKGGGAICFDENTDLPEPKIDWAYGSLK